VKGDGVNKLVVYFAVVLFLFAAQGVWAQQQFDVAFGLGTVGTEDPPDFNSATLRGGAFPAFSGDFLFKHNLGIQGEVAWRASRNIFQGFQPYRPILYDFNGIYAPSFGNRFGAEVMGGIGALSTRVYQQFTTCSFTSCTNYTSSNHLAGHVGGGLKFYVTHSFFVRPEAHYYFIRNNDEYGVGRAARYGVSIGYTMRNEVQ
jgi:hypothetical protein